MLIAIIFCVGLGIAVAYILEYFEEEERKLHY